MKTGGIEGNPMDSSTDLVLGTVHGISAFVLFHTQLLLSLLYVQNVRELIRLRFNT